MVLEEQEIPRLQVKVQMVDPVVVVVQFQVVVMLLVAVLLTKATPGGLELMEAITEEVEVVVPAL